jgi:hypothetical protein
VTCGFARVGDNLVQLGPSVGRSSCGVGEDDDGDGARVVLPVAEDGVVAGALLASVGELEGAVVGEAVGHGEDAAVNLL